MVLPHHSGAHQQAYFLDLSLSFFGWPRLSLTRWLSQRLGSAASIYSRPLQLGISETSRFLLTASSETYFTTTFITSSVFMK